MEWERFLIRGWDASNHKVTTQMLTVEEITYKCQSLHLNMADVGLVLLNIEREKNGMAPIDPAAIADNNGNFGV